MNINQIRPLGAISTHSTASGEPAVAWNPTRGQEIRTVLNKIDRKYPNLERDLAEALVTEQEIAKSDTWEGLKWYEVCIAPIAIKGNKIMKMTHRETVKKLQNLVTVRAQLQAELISL